jgi:hypothetical protein
MLLKLCAACLVLALPVAGLGNFHRQPIVRRKRRLAVDSRGSHESMGSQEMRQESPTEIDSAHGQIRVEDHAPAMIREGRGSRIPSAIVYLANDVHLERGRGQCPTIYDSLHSLKVHMPWTDWNQTNIIIMHESGKMSTSNMHLIRAAAPCDVVFQNVDVYDADVLLFRRLPYEPATYLHMCNFWSSGIFKLSFLPEYVMRMDTDACLSSDMPHDPFDRMRRGNIKYMWHSKMLENPTWIVGLRSFVEEHGGNTDDYWNKSFSDEYLRKWKEQQRKWNISDEFGKIPVYSTNLEWFHMPSFREPAIAKWTEQVRQSGGIWMHRWGDAPLRTIAVNQFMNTSKEVLRFCEFEYAHSNWPPFERCASENSAQTLYWDPTFLKGKPLPIHAIH